MPSQGCSPLITAVSRETERERETGKKRKHICQQQHTHTRTHTTHTVSGVDPRAIKPHCRTRTHTLLALHKPFSCRPEHTSTPTCTKGGRGGGGGGGGHAAARFVAECCPRPRVVLPSSVLQIRSTKESKMYSPSALSAARPEYKARGTANIQNGILLWNCLGRGYAYVAASCSFEGLRWTEQRGDQSGEEQSPIDCWWTTARFQLWIVPRKKRDQIQIMPRNVGLLIHPSIDPSSIRVCSALGYCRVEGFYPCCCGKRRQGCTLDKSPVHLRETSDHQHFNYAFKCAAFCIVGSSRGSRREPPSTRTQNGHRLHTETPWGWNLWPSCWKVTLLTTLPLGCPWMLDVQRRSPCALTPPYLINGRQLPGDQFQTFISVFDGGHWLDINLLPVFDDDAAPGGNPHRSKENLQTACDGEQNYWPLVVRATVLSTPPSGCQLILYSSPWLFSTTSFQPCHCVTACLHSNSPTLCLACFLFLSSSHLL